MTQQIRTALEIQIRELFANPANVTLVGSNEGYTVTAVDAKGRTWVGNRESYCRRTLRGGVAREFEEEECIFDAVRVGKESDDSSYLLTVVNLAALADIEAYGRLFIAASGMDDPDVQNMMNELTMMLNVDVKLPEAQDVVISRIEYLMGMRQLMAADGGTDSDGDATRQMMAFDRSTGMATKITDISLQSHPFAGPYLNINHSGYALFGSTIVEVTKSTQIWDAGFRLNAAQFIPMTDELLAETSAAGAELVAQFVAESGYTHKQYLGNTYTPDMFGRRVAKHTSSRVVVDPRGCQMFDTRMFSSLMEMEGMNVKSNKKDEIVGIADPSPLQLAQIQPVLVVFNLTTSRWAIGLPANASAVKHRKDAFEKVILAAPRKRLVRALASFHNDAGQNIDIIDGKGGGNLFLLDGAPGTGKTLTAEATAEELERVLYKVSLGELGSSIERLEGALTRILALAERWNAVLLIDEADVFLEKRTSENLARNAVVAVFLRLLEYFGGLLFMTTNRGDNLDEAFLSRVTLALHFKKPDDEGQTAIWNGLLKNAGIKLTDTDITRLVAYGVNGREIKNAINTGRALAAQDGKPLGFLHIDEVLRTRELFFKEVDESVRGGLRG